MEDIITTAPWMIAVFVFLVIWELGWKAIALWKSAQRKQIAWFIVIILINSVGILPIIYLLLNRNKNSKKQVQKKRR